MKCGCEINGFRFPYKLNSEVVNASFVLCLVDGKPSYEQPPKDAIFVGMEQESNKPPRYGKLIHPWFNKPCYETPALNSDDYLLRDWDEAETDDCVDPEWSEEY